MRPTPLMVTQWTKLNDTTLHLNGLNSGIFNNKKYVKQVAVSKKVTANKYYQIAKSDEFLRTIKF